MTTEKKLAHLKYVPIEYPKLKAEKKMEGENKPNAGAKQYHGIKPLRTPTTRDFKLA